jgi:hypothetical protein
MIRPPSGGELDEETALLAVPDQTEPEPAPGVLGVGAAEGFVVVALNG